MLIPPKYFLTPKITSFLGDIEASKEVIDTISIPSEIELNIRRASTLKSSLFSARIEGNQLTLEELSTSSRDQKKIEVFNILKALNWIHERSARDITIKDLLNLHTICMKSLVSKNDLGVIRNIQEGVFSTGGIAVYHAPPPPLLTKLLERLIKYSNSSKEPLIPIRAVLAHYTFEKIHPFVDGSGRVGRLLIQMVLAKGGYDMKGTLSFEEKIDKRRETYYRMLEESERDLTDYIEYMLEILSASALEARKKISQINKGSPQDFLLPRRGEIYLIIKEHEFVNFDQIKRRFANINARTLRYDLKKLQDAQLVKKLGTTNGVYYRLNNPKLLP